MAEFSNRKNKQRQEWNPHWLLKILYGIWYLAVAAVKVAAGAVATVVLIALVCMFVFVGILGRLHHHPAADQESDRRGLCDSSAKGHGDFPCPAV